MMFVVTQRSRKCGEGINPQRHQGTQFPTLSVIKSEFDDPQQNSASVAETQILVQVQVKCTVEGNRECGNIA